MAVFAASDLKKLRLAQGMSVPDLAELISCDSSTINRYESGKIKPNPDVMYQICCELHAEKSWCDWMRTEYPSSYGRVHPEIPKLSFEGMLLRAFAEVQDIVNLQTEVMKDGATGAIDDEALRSRLRVECEEAIGTLQGLLLSLSKQGDGNE